MAEKSAADKLAEIMMENIARYNEDPDKYDDREYERSLEVDPVDLGDDGEEKPAPPKVKPSKFKRD